MRDAGCSYCRLIISHGLWGRICLLPLCCLEKGQAWLLHQDETLVYPKIFNDSYLQYSKEEFGACSNCIIEWVFKKDSLLLLEWRPLFGEGWNIWIWKKKSYILLSHSLWNPLSSTEAVISLNRIAWVTLCSAPNMPSVAYFPWERQGLSHAISPRLEQTEDLVFLSWALVDDCLSFPLVCEL